MTDPADYDDNNIFAKILRGEIPSHRVYEDQNTVAFMQALQQKRKQKRPATDA